MWALIQVYWTSAVEQQIIYSIYFKYTKVKLRVSCSIITKQFVAFALSKQSIYPSTVASLPNINGLYLKDTKCVHVCSGIDARHSSAFTSSTQHFQLQYMCLVASSPSILVFHNSVLCSQRGISSKQSTAFPSSALKI